LIFKNSFLDINVRINRQTRQVVANFFFQAQPFVMNHMNIKYKLIIPKEIKEDNNGFVVIHVIKEGDNSHSDFKTQIRGRSVKELELTEVTN
jgi:hypothetical protein